jgi:hypothetical protein
MGTYNFIGYMIFEACCEFPTTAFGGKGHILLAKSKNLPKERPQRGGESWKYPELSHLSLTVGISLSRLKVVRN